MARVQLSNVSKAFADQQVLSNINLSINNGEFVIFVGPSGSGKSTLLRLLAGLEQVTEGRLLIDDEDLTDAPPRQRQVAMVFQNYALYPHMSVAKNITFGMRIRKEDKSSQEQALARAVSLLQLEGLLDRKPRQLSGGQRQRVAMARAIVRNPSLFLMDEPLSNLDAKLRNEVRLSIMDLQRELGCTMVYVTHDQVEAMTMADRVVVLNQGRIQQVGTPQDLYHFPVNQFTAGFIGTPAMNFLELRRADDMLYLPDKTPLPLPVKLKPRLGQVERITLGLRPENLFVNPGECPDFKEGESGERHTPITLNTRIRTREMHGSEFLLHTGEESGGITFRHKNNGLLPQGGEQVRLHFSLASAHFFHADTGQRLN